MKKRIWSLFGFLSLIAILVVGCGTGDNDEGVSGMEKPDTLTVGYLPDYASNSSVIAGINTGAFESQNLKLELIEFEDGPTIISALESGSIEIGYIGGGAHVLPVQGEADIFSWAQLSKADEVIGNVSRGIETIEDLEGKQIAVSTGTTSEMILDLTLAEAGLTQDDVEVIDMNASAMVTAMISGKIDAVSTWAPSTIAIKKELGDDAVMLRNNEDYTDIAPAISSWVTRPGYVEENEDLLLRYAKALMDGFEYRLENPEEVAGWVAKEIALDKDSVLEQIDVGVWGSKESIIEMINNGEMAKMYDQQARNFIESGRLEEDEFRPAEEYVLFDLMLKAAQH